MKLNEYQLEYYNHIIESLKNFEKKIIIPENLDEEDGKEIFFLVGDNEVELFYVDFNSYIIGKKLGSSYIFVEYFYNKNEVYRKKLLLEEKKSEILKGYCGKDEVEATEYIHDYIAEIVRYDFAAINRKNQGKAATIEGVLLDGMAVCHGIARAARYLLKDLGIDSVVVRGEGLSEEEELYAMGKLNHAWNINLLSVGAYHMDITWDIKEASPLMKVLHKCCNMDESMAIEGHDWDILQYPRANKNDANYYARRGLYFRNRQSLLKYAKRCIEKREKEMEFCLDPCAGFPDDHGKMLIQQIMDLVIKMTGESGVEIRYLYDDKLLVSTILLKYK